MSLGHAIAGGIVGLVVGLAVGGKKAKQQGASGTPSCPVTRVNEWMTERQMGGVFVTSQAQLTRVPLDVDELEVVVTQDTCTAFTKQDGAWTADDELTQDLATFLSGATPQFRTASPEEPPISRPVL